jgi:D-alanyl-lipoteichoic acid acyltransferase DltB (MBOAT superfamily)
VIDIYNQKIKPEYDYKDYALFVSFFPLLVAGPIERATHLLPQFKKNRQFDYAKSVEGLRQMAWGFFKKIVIADSCSTYANQIFEGHASYSGSTLLAGAFFFTFQIYCDFSGYSDIALGTARLFGIDLLRNFSYPYFSRDIAEFWRRWHMSLSSWFRDYVYIPLGGSKVSTLKKIRNTFVIFLLSGFWHGANWTFVFWGGLNAIYFLPLLLTDNNRSNIAIVGENSRLPSLKETASILMTFLLTIFAWIFFRANNLSDAFSFIAGIFSVNLFIMPAIWPWHVLFFIVLLVTIEWLGRRKTFPLENLHLHFNTFSRWAFYFVLVVLIFMFYGNNQTFIYFQF